MTVLLKSLYNYMFQSSPKVNIQVRANENTRRTIIYQYPISKNAKTLTFGNSIDVITKSGPQSINIDTFDINNNDFEQFNRKKEWTQLFHITGSFTDPTKILTLVQSGIRAVYDDDTVNEMVTMYYDCFLEHCHEPNKEYTMAFCVTSSDSDGHITNTMVCRLLNNELGFYTAKFYASC